MASAICRPNSKRFPRAYLTVGILEHHDRRRFEVIGYSTYSDDGSAFRRRVARAFDRFVDLSKMQDLEAAQVIHAERLDVLIDLDGLLPFSRPKICSLLTRPDPG